MRSTSNVKSYSAYTQSVVGASGSELKNAMSIRNSLRRKDSSTLARMTKQELFELANEAKISSHKEEFLATKPVPKNEQKLDQEEAVQATQPVQEQEAPKPTPHRAKPNQVIQTDEEIRENLKRMEEANKKYQEMQRNGEAGDDDIGSILSGLF